MALRAKFKFETDVFFMILRSKIMKNTSASKEYSANSNLFDGNYLAGRALENNILACVHFLRADARKK